MIISRVQFKVMDVGGGNPVATGLKDKQKNSELPACHSTSLKLKSAYSLEIPSSATKEPFLRCSHPHFAEEWEQTFAPPLLNGALQHDRLVGAEINTTKMNVFFCRLCHPHLEMTHRGCVCSSVCD